MTWLIYSYGWWPGGFVREPEEKDPYSPSTSCTLAKTLHIPEKGSFQTPTLPFSPFQLLKHVQFITPTSFPFLLCCFFAVKLKIYI